MLHRSNPIKFRQGLPIRRLAAVMDSHVALVGTVVFRYSSDLMVMPFNQILYLVLEHIPIKRFGHRSHGEQLFIGWCVRYCCCPWQPCGCLWFMFCRWSGSLMAQPLVWDVPNTLVHTSIKWFVHKFSGARVTAVAVLAVIAVQTAAVLPFWRMFSQWSGGPISEPFNRDVYYILNHAPINWFCHRRHRSGDFSVTVNTYLQPGQPSFYQMQGSFLLIIFSNHRILLSHHVYHSTTHFCKFWQPLDQFRPGIGWSFRSVHLLSLLQKSSYICLSRVLFCHWPIDQISAPFGQTLVHISLINSTNNILKWRGMERVLVPTLLLSYHAQFQHKHHCKINCIPLSIAPWFLLNPSYSPPQ